MQRRVGGNLVVQEAAQWLGDRQNWMDSRKERAAPRYQFGADTAPSLTYRDEFSCVPLPHRKGGVWIFARTHDASASIVVGRGGLRELVSAGAVLGNRD